MKQSGFTLIELFVTLVVMGVVASVALPAMAEMVTAQRRFDVAQQLASGLRTARVEAITRHQVILLHAIDEDWSKGWRISTNPSGKGAGDERNVLLTERSFGGKIPIAARLRDRPYVSFNSLGATSTSNGRLFICDQEEAVSHYEVIIAVTGRVTIENQKKPEERCG
ncbi:GspH/FimT family pseudopilin [Pseudomonas caspiana]